MESLSDHTKFMPQGFNDLNYLSVTMCQITTFVMIIQIKSRTAQGITESLMHRCKVQNGVLGCRMGCHLYQGITQVFPLQWSNNKVLVPVYTLFIGLLVPSSAGAVLCLTPLVQLPKVLQLLALLFLLFWFFQLCSYFTESACPLLQAFAASFIQGRFHSVCWDSMYVLCMLGYLCLAFSIYDWFPLYAGVVCLTFLAFDWPTACWDSLIRLLHAWIVCLTSLASDCPIAWWDSLFAHSMLGQHSSFPVKIGQFACWDSMSMTHTILSPYP